jgi:hypothetical protein
MAVLVSGDPGAVPRVVAMAIAGVRGADRPGSVFGRCGVPDAHAAQLLGVVCSPLGFAGTSPLSSR